MFVALDLCSRLVCAHIFHCCSGCSNERLLVLLAIGKSFLLFSTRTFVVVRAHVPSHLLGKNFIGRNCSHVHHTIIHVDSYCLWRYSYSVAPCCAPLVRTRTTGHQIVEVTSRSSLAVYFHLFCTSSFTKFCLSCLHTYMFL